MMREKNSRSLEQSSMSIRQLKQQKVTSRRKKVRQQKCYLLSFVLLFFLIFSFADSKRVDAATKIYVEASNVEVFQDSDIPTLSVNVTVEGDSDVVLDAESNYTVQSLVTDLENGIGLSVLCEAYVQREQGDDMTEGTYTLDVELDPTYQSKVIHEWLGEVKVYVQDANVVVMNKTGYWQGDTFLTWEGESLSSQWITDGGETYYLDESGGKYQESSMRVGLMYYEFNSEGALISEGEYIDSEKPMLALTFDDGPSEFTQELVDLFEAYNSHATFFVLGTKLGEDDRELLTSMVENGCEIGNHTTNHPYLTSLSVEEIQDEIETTNDKVEALTGIVPVLMRPTYGATNELVEETIDMPLILWNVDTGDWNTNSSATILDEILSEAEEGAIILMHDTKELSLEAVKQAIPILIEQGYQLVTVSELFEAKDIELEDGVKYYSAL